MEAADILNSKAVKSLMKGSLMLIGLVFVLSCVIAVLLFPFDKEIEVSTNTIASANTQAGENTKINGNADANSDKVTALISVLTKPLFVLFFILFVFFIFFSCLVSFCYNKSNEQSRVNKRNLQDKHEMDILKETIPLIVKDIASGSKENVDILKKMLCLILKDIATDLKGNNDELQELISKVLESLSPKAKTS